MFPKKYFSFCRMVQWYSGEQFFFWRCFLHFKTISYLDCLGIGQEATNSGPIHHTESTSLHASYTESSARSRTFNVEPQKIEPPTNSIPLKYGAVFR